MKIRMDSPIVLKIKSMYPGLKPSEKKAADYILMHTEEFIYGNLASSSKAAGISEASLVRFAKCLGYGGYRDLHIAVASAKQEPADAIVSDLEVSDTTPFSEIPEIVISRTICALSNMRQTIDQKDFSKAVDALEKARRVCIFGAGNSAFVGQDLAGKLMRLGKAVQASSDPHAQTMSAVSMNSRDVAVIITHSGKTNQTVEMLLLAKRQGAKTISITNFESSPAANLADIFLLTASHEKLFSSENLMSCLSQLALIDMLYLGLVQKNYSRYAPIIEKQIQTVAPLFFQSKD